MSRSSSGLAVGLNFFVEGADDRELEAVQPDDLMQSRAGAAEHAPRQLIREERHLGPRGHVVGIQKAAGPDDDVAYRGIGVVSADHLDVLFFAADQEAVKIRHDAGGGDDFGGQFTADGFHVRHFDVIRVGCGAAGPGRDVIPEDDVGADALHLFQDVVPACERDGDHQDDRRGADDHAEGREHGADRVGAQRLGAEAESFA